MAGAAQQLPTTPGWYLVEDLADDRLFPAKLRLLGDELTYVGPDGRWYRPAVNEIWHGPIEDWRAVLALITENLEAAHG